MSEGPKEGKLINVDPARWGAPRKSAENKEKKVFIALDFQFAQVPFDKDGNMDDLYNDDTEKPGVKPIKPVDIKSIPAPFGLSLKESDVRGIDEATEGAFLEFLKGGEGLRFILLAGQKQQLNKLRSYVPEMSTEFQKKFLEVFIKNVDLALQEYGEQAALIII